MNVLLVLAAAAFALWLFRGGQMKAAGEHLRSWSSAIVGGAVALFVIADVIPHLGHG